MRPATALAPLFRPDHPAPVRVWHLQIPRPHPNRAPHRCNQPVGWAPASRRRIRSKRFGATTRHFKPDGAFAPSGSISALGVWCDERALAKRAEWGEYPVLLGEYRDPFNDTSDPRHLARTPGLPRGSDEERIALVGQAVAATIANLLKIGHHVVLVYPVPEVGWNVPMHLARITPITGSSGISKPLSTSHEVYLDRSASAYLDAIPDSDNLLRIRPAELFCDTEIPDRCMAQLPDSRPFYFDNNHPNELGARMIAEEIIRVMRAKGWIRTNREV